ncbi:MAG: GNAT family N-acetyltransferase [Polyangiales bacterium]
MADLRILRPGDAAALEAWLVPRLASSMILLSNSRSGGLSDRGERLQGTYAGAFEGSRLVGVVGHFWNQNAILQTPEVYAAPLCELAVRTSGRALAGFLGPSQQVSAALSGLRITRAQLQLDSNEVLFSLALDALRVPAPLRDGRVQVRVGQASDLDLLIAWRIAYNIEALHARETPEMRETSRAWQERAIEGAHVWVAEVAGEPVATSAFNAQIDEAVQIGGVYTPPAHRSRGYARAAVAQSLLDAKQRGVNSSILFTGEDNPAAQRAYRELGYQPVGDYRIALLNEPLDC